MKLFEDLLVDFLIVQNVAIEVDTYDEHVLLKLINVRQAIYGHLYSDLNQLERTKVRQVLSHHMFLPHRQSNRSFK